MTRLEQLIRWYMQFSGYTRPEAIASIKADLDTLSKGTILKGGYDGTNSNHSSRGDTNRYKLIHQVQ